MPSGMDAELAITGDCNWLLPESPASTEESMTAKPTRTVTATIRKGKVRLMRMVASGTRDSVSAMRRGGRLAGVDIKLGTSTGGYLQVRYDEHKLNGVVKRKLVKSR